jgi:uncharacterized membrane protein YgdD (TMEM256/DUF423 family)
MDKRFLSISFLLGAAAVALGAFGAHALKEMVDERAIQTYQTAVQYHFYHLFALALTGLLLKAGPNVWFKRAGYLFISGIIVFSGSLYSMTFLKAASVEGVQWLGAITPLGGVCFIAGWLLLLVGLKAVPKN